MAEETTAAAVTPPASATVPATVSVDRDALAMTLREVDRLKAVADGHKGEAAAARAEKAAAEEAATTRVTDAETKANQRIIMAELKAHAIRAGVADLDYLKLVDTSAIKIGDDGELAIPSDFFAKWKESKPHHFGAAATTTQTAAAPKPASTGARRAVDMTDAEYKAAKVVFLRNSGASYSVGEVVKNSA
jgi:hypothetical protein